MKHPAFPDGVARDTAVRWYREARARSKLLFAIPAEETYYDRPIVLRNPIVFYEGHLPAFSVNTLVKSALKRSGINDAYEVLFARGIDPEDEASAKSPTDLWPARTDVQQYGRSADALIEDALANETLDDDRAPQLRGSEAVFTILEHEQMHHETFLYMLHNLPCEKKRAIALPNAHIPQRVITSSPNDLIAIPPGIATLGADRGRSGFGWDNEFPSHRVEVGGFRIQRHNVTNAEFQEFVDARGYEDRSLWDEEAWRWLQANNVGHPHFWHRIGGVWYWRAMFEIIPLPERWPVFATHAEAGAYARWRGLRLPTEAEYHRAAFGTPSGEERSFPWGDQLPDATRGNFDFIRWDPLPVGSFSDGASAWGVHDLIGNGWEWTSTHFDGFPGFEPMPSYPVYSNDFFDRQHFVMKGASPVTAREMIRGSFRNWFRPTYPYVYATFRCAA